MWRVFHALYLLELWTRARISKARNKLAIRRGETEAPAFWPAAGCAAALVSVALPLMLAALLALATDVGDDVEPAFFSAVVALLPLLLIAFMVEAALALREVTAASEDEDWESAEEREDVLAAFHEMLLSRVVWSVAVGEAAALYALATGTSSTFLAALALLPLIRVMPELLRAHRVHVAPLRTERREMRNDSQDAGV